MSTFETLAAHLRDDLQSGHLTPGIKLPSTTQPRTRFKASYGTVHAAMPVLKAHRLIVGRQGEVVFVTAEADLDGWAITRRGEGQAAALTSVHIVGPGPLRRWPQQGASGDGRRLETRPCG